MSGDLTTNLVVPDNTIYPYGTTEMFPVMEDSDLQALDDSAHYYMECSNKGTCDRTSGTCTCFEGYEGVSCQRASCPNSCSGHGVCKTKRQLAAADNGNTYLLWDKDITMGCLCDPGFTGPDCSQRVCKYGVDPLYLDDSSTVKYPIFDFATLTTSATPDFTDGTPQLGPGKFAIRFYDIFGEDWLTQAIPAGATCDEVIAALEALPNNIIPVNTIECSRTSGTDLSEKSWISTDSTVNIAGHVYQIAYNMSIWQAETAAHAGDPSTINAITTFEGSYGLATSTTLSGFIYRVKFYGNPGAIPQPKIELYLDGQRPSLVSTAGKVITTVWTDGQQGENNDYISDYCENVVVTIGNDGTNFYLTDLTLAEKALLKTCLGDADLDSTNNVGVYNWDVGSREFPHFIKLVRSLNTYKDGAYYAALWFDSSVCLDNSGDSTSGTFRLLNPFSPPDALSTDRYEIYTTKGTLALTSKYSETVVSFASPYFYSVNSTYDATTSGHHANFDGDISCYSSSADVTHVPHCLNKEDLFTILNFDTPKYNPAHLNLYTAKHLYTDDFSWSVSDRFSTGTGANQLHYMTNVIKADLSSNWGTGTFDSAKAKTPFRTYKFIPAASSTYNYVNECSNRGICGTDTGICTCFPGYTNDDCSVQNSIAM